MVFEPDASEVERLFPLSPVMEDISLQKLPHAMLYNARFHPRGNRVFRQTHYRPFNRSNFFFVRSLHYTATLVNNTIQSSGNFSSHRRAASEKIGSSFLPFNPDLNSFNRTRVTGSGAQSWWGLSGRFCVNSEGLCTMDIMKQSRQDLWDFYKRSLGKMVIFFKSIGRHFFLKPVSWWTKKYCFSEIYGRIHCVSINCGM